MVVREVDSEKLERGDWRSKRKKRGGEQSEEEEVILRSMLGQD